jgi:hypothetical protein
LKNSLPNCFQYTIDQRVAADCKTIWWAEYNIGKDLVILNNKFRMFLIREGCWQKPMGIWNRFAKFQYYDGGKKFEKMN